WFGRSNGCRVHPFRVRLYSDHGAGCCVDGRVRLSPFRLIAATTAPVPPTMAPTTAPDAKPIMTVTGNSARHITFAATAPRTQPSAPPKTAPNADRSIGVSLRATELDTAGCAGPAWGYGSTSSTEK